MPEKGDKLRTALESLHTVVTVLDVLEDGDFLQLTCRVSAQQREVWINIVDVVLREEERAAAEGAKWKLHVCRQYLRHEGRLRATWNFTMYGDVESGTRDIARLFDLLSRNLETVQTKPVTQRAAPQYQVQQSGNVPNAGSGTMRGRECIDFPLVGQTENRNKPQSPLLSKGSKGAHMISEKT